MMKRDCRHLFNIGAVLVALGAVVLAMGYNRPSRLMPLLIGVPMLILAIVQMGLDFRKDWAEKKSSLSTDASLIRERDDEARLIFAREVNVSLWVIALFVALYVFGFALTTFFYTLLYLKVPSGYSWKVSLSVSAGAFVFLYIVLIRAFGLDLYAGVAMLALRKVFFGY